MIKKEHQTWLALGGKLSGDDFVNDLLKTLKQTQSFQSLPDDDSIRDTVLYLTALNIIAKEKAHLIHTLHIVRTAITDDDIAKAKILIDKLFDN